MFALFVVDGVAVPIMQCQLGHASLATMNTYLAHIAPKGIIETNGPPSSKSLRTLCWASRRTARVISYLIDVFETVGRNETAGFMV